MIAKYIGENKDLWKRVLVEGTTHDIYLTSYDTNSQKGWISIDEETYPITFTELLSEWEVEQQ